MHRIEKKRQVLDRTVENNRKKVKYLTTQISRSNQTHCEITTVLRRKCISTENNSEKCFRDEPINVRSIFAAFHIGTAGLDIGKALGMIGVMDASSFERNFTRYSHKISKSIREVA